jgi:hypothetical protein
MRYRFVLEALTPIAHGDTRTGIDNPTNTRLFMTQSTVANGRLVYTPHISENALRSVMLRSPLADHLLQVLGIERGQIPRAVLNLLYAGGNMSGARAPGDEKVLGHSIKKLYPSLDLLGGAVDSFIIPRSRLKLAAFIVAEEYLTPIRALFPALEDGAKAVSTHDLIGEEVRTRGTSDEAKGRKEDGSNQMLYSYETLAAGARIAVELTLDLWTPEPAVSAVARGLAEWTGYIGGQGRQGRGRCTLEWLDDTPTPDCYDAHIAEHAEVMRDGILTGTLGQGKVLCAA